MGAQVYMFVEKLSMLCQIPMARQENFYETCNTFYHVKYSCISLVLLGPDFAEMFVPRKSFVISRVGVNSLIISLLIYCTVAPLFCQAVW